MTDQPDGRAYVAKCQFKGARKPFYYGTVFVRLGATHQEIETAILARFDDILTPGIPRPDIIMIQPGMLVFLPEGAK